MADTKIVHRIALPRDGRSMWYDKEARLDPILPGVESIPMPYDELRAELDRDGTWLSSVEDDTLLETWFPDGLLAELYALGFIHRVFEIQHWVDLPNETVFKMETARELEVRELA